MNDIADLLNSIETRAAPSVKPLTIDEAMRARKLTRSGTALVRLSCAPRRSPNRRNLQCLLGFLMELIRKSGLPAVSESAKVATRHDRQASVLAGDNPAAMIAWARDLARAGNPTRLEKVSFPVAAVYMIRALITAETYRQAPNHTLAATMAVITDNMGWRTLSLRWAREAVKALLDERGASGTFEEADMPFCAYYLDQNRNLPVGARHKTRLRAAFRGVVELNGEPATNQSPLRLLPACQVAHDRFRKDEDSLKTGADQTNAASAAGAGNKLAKVLVGTSAVTGGDTVSKHVLAKIGHGARLMTAPADAAHRLAKLRAEYPWAPELLSWVQSNILTTEAANQAPVRLHPLLLVGAPGTGKSRFAKRMAQLLDLPCEAVNLGGANSALVLRGTPKGYTSACVSLPLEVITRYQCANPMVIVDEIDKCATGSENGRAADALLAFLEPGEACRHFDDGLGVAVDLSRVNWVLTANRLDRVPGPLRSRCRVMAMPSPAPEHVPDLVKRIAGDVALRLKGEGRATDVLSRRALAEITLSALDEKISPRRIAQIVEDELKAASTDLATGRRYSNPGANDAPENTLH